MQFDSTPLLLTLKLALLSTGILFIVAIPISLWLSGAKNRIGLFARAFANLPLVLPPSVLGFYLLVAFNPSGPLGAFLNKIFGIQLVFSFTGLVVASILFNAPFMINPLVTGFQSIPVSLRQAALVMGKGKLVTLLRVLLPNMKPALLSGIVLTFAHTVGEFGVALMIGGKIPGETRVASIAIYDEVEMLNYNAANVYASVLLIFAFVLMLLLFYVNKKLSITS
jgi:molybdate transport system permease protein